jgi:hypothetical protein
MTEVTTSREIVNDGSGFLELKWNMECEFVIVRSPPEECALPEGSHGRGCSRKWYKVRAWQFLSEGTEGLEHAIEEKEGGLSYVVRQT